MEVLVEKLQITGKNTGTQSSYEYDSAEQIFYVTGITH